MMTVWRVWSVRLEASHEEMSLSSDPGRSPYAMSVSLRAAQFVFMVFCLQLKLKNRWSGDLPELVVRLESDVTVIPFCCSHTAVWVLSRPSVRCGADRGPQTELLVIAGVAERIRETSCECQYPLLMYMSPTRG